MKMQFSGDTKPRTGQSAIFGRNAICDVLRASSTPQIACIPSASRPEYFTNSDELRSPEPQEYFTVSYENTSFALYLEPIRNTYHKKYQNIITLSAVPTGPLARMVKQIRPAKLSEFQPVVGERCIYALTRYTRGYNIKDERAYMGAHDLPSIYGYLAANGYQVDTRLTKMTFQSSIDIGSDPYTQEGTRKLICMVSSPIQSLG